MTDLTYTNKDGEEVYTSKYLKNRGTCCKTNCLHCPYGFTLKNNPLEFIDLKISDIPLAQSLVNSSSTDTDTISSSLLNSAFGGSSSVIKITKFNITNYQFVKIKNEVCGLVKKGKIQPQELYLKDVFKNQRIDLDLVKSQY